MSKPAEESPQRAGEALRARPVPPAPQLSYKFQRLRERLRAAIASGELSGKLPGERQLAKTLRVNAKTLSKALTDLAAEGLLERTIGRGTYVRADAAAAMRACGAASVESGGEATSPAVEAAVDRTPGRRAAVPTARSVDAARWLILCDESAWSPVVDRLSIEAQRAGGRVEVRSALDDIRPSFLKPFGGVVDFTSGTPDTHLRELIVRGMSVVVVNQPPRTFSTHRVMIDLAPGAAALAREAMFLGHRRLFVIEPVPGGDVAPTVQRVTERYEGAVVDVGGADDVVAAVRHGVTWVICASPALAEEAASALASAGCSVPAGVSLSAVGVAGALPRSCSGYYVRPETVAETIAGLLRGQGASMRRPAQFWLNGAFHEGHTLAGLPAADFPIQSSPTGPGAGAIGAGLGARR